MAATYTVKQVAQILGYSTNSIYTFLKEKRIKGVRVGTGRFRIPQSELNRLLLVKKTPPSQEPVGVQDSMLPPAKAPDQGVSELTDANPIQFGLFGTLQVGTPNIFSWYTGVAAVVAGLAMYLFNKSFDSDVFTRMAPFLGAIQVVFVGSGIGIILTNSFGELKNVWHRTFSFLLGSTGAIASVMLWIAGDKDGAFIYGLLALVVLLAAVSKIGGIASIALYMTLLGAAFVFLPILAPADQHVAEFLRMIHVSPWTAAGLFAVISALYFPILWWGYLKSRRVFWICAWIGAIGYFLLALWYANNQYWARSFFFIVTAIATAFLGPWEALQLTHNRRERVLTLVTLLGIFVLLILGVITVYLMQLNILSTIKRENAYKLEYAQILVGSIVEGVESTLAGVGSDASLVAAIAKKDAATMNDIARTIMDSNSHIRRIVVLDAKGDGVNIYPFGTFDKPNLGFRDYFMAARDTGKPYVSNVFTALVDNQHRPVISVAAPILGKGNVFTGVIVASLDLGNIGAKLQKIAVPERGEYVFMADANGKIIVNGQSYTLGGDVEAGDPILLGTEGRRGSRDGVLSDGRRAMVTYGPIKEVQWGIAIKTPYVHIYELAAVANLSVFGLVLGCILSASIFLQGAHLFWRRGKPAREGSP